MDGPKAALHKSSKPHQGFWKAQSDISTGEEAVFPGSKLRRPLEVVQRDWYWGCFPNCPEGQRRQQQASTAETREGSQSLPLEVTLLLSPPLQRCSPTSNLFVVLFFCTGSSQSHDINKRFHQLPFARSGEKGGAFNWFKWKSVREELFSSGTN